MTKELFLNVCLKLFRRYYIICCVFDFKKPTSLTCAELVSVLKRRHIIKVGHKLKNITVLGIFFFLLQKTKLRVIAKRTLLEYWEKNPNTEQQLSAWYREASKADWENPNEIKEQYASASILQNSRVVFNICGNKYRLVVEINFPRKWVFIRFVGTHEEYDKINVNSI